MRNEIYQRFWDTQIIKTKANKLIEAKIPRGVFVARKTNKGEVFASLSLVHKNDKFNIKDGLNIARKNAVKLDRIVYLSDKESEAYERFQERAAKYFRVGKFANWEPNWKLKKQIKKDDWTGKIVNLIADEYYGYNHYYLIRKDNGDTVDCSCVGFYKSIKASDHVYRDRKKNLFVAPQ